MKQIEPKLVGAGFWNPSTESFYHNQIGKSVYSSGGTHLGKIIDADALGIECGKRLFGTGPWIDKKYFPSAAIDYFEESEVILNPRGYEQRYA
jgi:hypothetical protein